MALAIPARLLTSVHTVGLLSVAIVFVFASTTTFAQNPPREQNGGGATPEGAAGAPAHPDEGDQGSDLPPLRIGNVVVTASAQLDALKVNDDRDEAFEDGFRVRRARIGLAGNLTRRIGWNLSGEMTDSPVLRNAYVVVRFAKALNVRLGQATPPQGIERGTSRVDLEFIDRTRITTELTYGHEAGISVFNEAPLRGWLSYAVSVVNGAGTNRRDDNDAKDLIGRVEIVVPRVPYLSIVATAASGRQPTGERTRHTVGAEYKSPAITVTAEALRERSPDAAVRDGFYASGVYRIRARRPRPNFRMIELVARFSLFDDPLADAEDPGALPINTREIQAGGNYYVNRNVRVMFNVLVPVDTHTGGGTSWIARAQVAF